MWSCCWNSNKQIAILFGKQIFPVLHNPSLEKKLQLIILSQKTFWLWNSVNSHLIYLHDEIMYLIKVKLNIATDYFNQRQVLDHFSVHVKGRLSILKSNVFIQISLNYFFYLPAISENCHETVFWKKDKKLTSEKVHLISVSRQEDFWLSLVGPTKTLRWGTF